MSKEIIRIGGAREHNLKNLTLKIPHDKLVVITGLSGSGKSSLASDTIYAEGHCKYVESLSTYARQFLDQMQKPEVDYNEGLSPAIAIEQRTSGMNPRSTVATTTEIYDRRRVSTPQRDRQQVESACTKAQFHGEIVIAEGVQMVVQVAMYRWRKSYEKVDMGLAGFGGDVDEGCLGNASDDPRR